MFPIIIKFREVISKVIITIHTKFHYPNFKITIAIGIFLWFPIAYNNTTKYQQVKNTLETSWSKMQPQFPFYYSLCSSTLLNKIFGIY